MLHAGAHFRTASGRGVAPGRRAGQRGVDLEIVAAERRRGARFDAARPRDRDLVDAGDPARARRHHDHAVGEEHRLGDRMGDEDDGLPRAAPRPRAGLRPRCAAARGSSRRASSRRARRTARPSAGSADRAAAPGRARRAAACRRTARADACRRTRRGRPDRAAAGARSRYFAGPAPDSSAGSSTLSSTERHFSSTAAWNTMPTRETGPTTGAPSTKTRPDVTGRSPAMMRISVDLPQPLGPTSGDELAFADRQDDAAQRLDRAALGPVDHADVLDADQRTARGHGSARPAWRHFAAPGIATLVRNSVV